MISSTVALFAIALYIAILFCIAEYVERRPLGRRVAAHPVVYALGLAVYCSTWTYYGSVGKASTGGFGFLPVYLGPTLALMFGGTTFRRIAALRHAHRITSIADFISARYGKSEVLAAAVTLSLVVGIVPYIALQMKAVSGTFELLTRGADGISSGLAQYFSPLSALMMLIFTIVFGIRHLDPTERHPGMVVSLAVESVLKLVAFLVAGVFIVGLAFGDFSGFLSRVDDLAHEIPMMTKASGSEVLSWVTVTLLSSAAFAFLPRQFHVGVIENSEARHTRTAQWLTPLYLLAINVLVVPIAVGGLHLGGSGSPDQFVLSLPLKSGPPALALAVFVGGFSAAIGMIMIETMAMATMISNHLVLPLAQRIPRLAWLHRRVLPVRWVAATAFIGAGYVFEVAIGSSYMLVAIGLISFAAAFLLAPVILGGLWWRRASKGGAILGLGLGFLTWFYTLLVPTFVRSDWLAASLLSQGPWGLSLLRPEALFGWEGIPGLAHGTIWSTLAVIVGWLGGSALFPASREERLLTEEFLEPGAKLLEHLDSKNATIDAAEKRSLARALFARTFPAAELDSLVQRCFDAIRAGQAERLTHLQSAELHREVERTLAGAIGAPSAHAAMKEWGRLDLKDAKAMAREFAAVLAQMKLSPREIKQHIDFAAEREHILSAQFHELEQRVADRTQQIRTILDHVTFGFLVTDRSLTVHEGHTRSCQELFGSAQIAGRSLPELLEISETPAAASLRLAIEAVYEDVLPEVLLLEQIPRRYALSSGLVLHLEGRAIRDAKGNVEKLLLSVSNATALEAAQHETQLHRALIEILKRREAFLSFLADTRARLENALSLVDEPGDQRVVRREVHTIKGNAAAFGLTEIVRQLHAIEEHRIGRAELEQSVIQFRSFLEDHASVLGMRFDAAEQDRFTVSSAELAELRQLVNAPEKELWAGIERWCARTARRPALDLLGPIDAFASRLAERLEKPLEFILVGGDTLVDVESMGPVLQTMSHLLRNAVDHGIEQGSARGAKPSRATILLSVEDHPAQVRVAMEDDGRGIDAEAVARAAVASGRISAELAASLDPSAKLELVFLDGVSTRAQASETSGRGVGMAAVRAATLAAGGQLRLHSRPGLGLRVEIVIPKPPVLSETSAPASADPPPAVRGDLPRLTLPHHL